MFSYIKHKELTLELAKREISDKFKGTFLGPVWFFLVPSFQIFLYIFVFSYILELKVNNNPDSDYGLYIISGLVPWICFIELLSKSVFAIIGNANLAKQTVFPLAVLPIKSALSSFFSYILFLFITTVYCASIKPTGWEYGLLILIALFQLAFFCGISLIISSISVFFKDMKDVIQLFAMIGIYILPIIYTMDMVPEIAGKFMNANPLTHMIILHQDIIFYGQIAHGFSWLYWGTFSLLLLYFSNSFFKKTRPLFGDYV